MRTLWSMLVMYAKGVVVPKNQFVVAALQLRLFFLGSLTIGRKSQGVMHHLIRHYFSLTVQNKPNQYPAGN